MFQRVRTTFKVNPMQGVFGSVSANMGQSLNIPLNDLMQYIYDCLDKYSFAVVRSRMFSLVNVSSPKLGHSVGYSDITFDDTLVESGVLVLTFALVATPLKNLSASEAYIPLRSHDFLWGREGKGAEYLSIVLDISQKRNLFDIDINNRSLLNLYNAVGVCSKSFALHPQGWYESPVYLNINIESMRSQFLLKTPQHIFRNVPVGQWIYCKRIWQDYSFFIVPALIKENFFKYFTLYILRSLPPFLYGRSYDWVYRDSKSSYKRFIERGLTSVISKLNSNADITSFSDEEFSALALIAEALSGDSFSSTLADEEALLFYSVVRDQLHARNNEIKRQRFFSKLTDISYVSYKLITGDTEQLGISLEVEL